jgi:hypothetical protein
MASLCPDFDLLLVVSIPSCYPQLVRTARLDHDESDGVSTQRADGVLRIGEPAPEEDCDCYNWVFRSVWFVRRITLVCVCVAGVEKAP